MTGGQVSMRHYRMNRREELSKRQLEYLHKNCERLNTRRRQRYHAVVSATDENLAMTEEDPESLFATER